MLNSQARTSQAKRRGLITQFPIEKQCRMCLVVKPVSEFNRDSYKRDGLTRYCKPCQVAATAQWQKNNRTRNAEHGWKSRLKRKYGMTPEDYDALLKSQGSMCAICRTKEPGGKTGWHIDHCHKTDKVRGMLCGRCNRSIGAFEDDAELLQRAVDYLLKAA
jgi:hypothetical protein